MEQDPCGIPGPKIIKIPQLVKLTVVPFKSAAATTLMILNMFPYLRGTLVGTY